MSSTSVRRSYRQYCSVARSLDHVGGRWTLLIVRELLFGPRRFKDLLEALPGIGTNLLSERLAALEQDAIIERRTLPAPAGSAVYALTPLGQGLEEVLIALSRWGRQLLDDRQVGETFRLRWFMLGMRSSFRPEAARELSESYEFRIGDAVLHARVHRGELYTADGPAEAPALVLIAEPDAFLDLALRRRDPAELIRSGAVQLQGDPDALRRCMSVFATQTV